MTLKNQGVKIFGSNKIKGKEVANILLSEYPEISWAGVNIKGNKAFVKIVEKSEIPEVYNPEQKYNLVADADGVITTYYLKKGFPVVSKGDTVKKGQLLVSGVTDSSVKNIRYLNPEADINIVTWITEKSEANLVQIKDNYTNRVVKDTFIEINGKRYGIVRKVPFKYYNIKTTEKTVIPFIKLIKVNKMENVPQKIVYKDKELFEIERKKLYNKIVNGLKQEYRVIDTKYEYTSDGVKLYTTVTCVIEGPYVKKITADN
jgi:similar to stage IV sporulation protein